MCVNSGPRSPKKSESLPEGTARSAARAITEKIRHHSSPVGKYRASRMVRFSRFSPSSSGSLLRVEGKKIPSESSAEIEENVIDNENNENEIGRAHV